MSKSSPIKIFRKIIVPVLNDCDCKDALDAACLVGGKTVLMVGLVGVQPGEPLSSGALAAREVRAHLTRKADEHGVRRRARIVVSDNISAELRRIIAEEKADLLALDWSVVQSPPMQGSDLLTAPPCSLMLVRGPLPHMLEHVLAPLRGGPYAELALRLALTIAHSSGASVQAVHLVPPTLENKPDPAFRGIARIIASLPEVRLITQPTEDPAAEILARAFHTNLLVMGTSAQKGMPSSIGPVVERIFRESRCAVIAVKNMKPLPVSWESEMVGHSAISVLVDKWFAENTYHADEFSNLAHLVDLKRRQSTTISLALPALNEEETVGKVISTIKTALMDDIPLLDEIILIDSNSTDNTRQIGMECGIPVYIHQDILPQYGIRFGKGEVLWKSLYLTRGDIILWIDTDIVNITPQFVYGLVGPFLVDPRVQFVKGFYRRPLREGEKISAEGGGRVTELAARPLINLFYPELSGIIQPLAGEYGGRRAVLEHLPFFSGYGVEIGLLIGMFERFGLNAIAQVDLQMRIHRNQSLEALSKMSFAIIQTVFRKLEARYQRSFLEDVNKTMKLIRHEPRRFYLEVQEIAEQERTPMIQLPEYRSLWPPASSSKA